ncbi:MAG TPA: cytochrome c oxidase subunit 3 [Longimicrobiales bacterium]|nr:cytochrome c oxidase subunit 3 [Longimicrobiales bacterium]
MATAVAHDHGHGDGHAVHPPTSTGLNTWKVGFWVFMGSETLFFGTLIGTYMVYRGTSVVGPYPQDILDIPLTTLSTFVLLMSSLAVVLALEFLQQGRRNLALFWTMMIIVLGCGFLGFQAYEFTHFYKEGLTLSTNMFGSTFFVLTGFHGAHVTVGVIWLLVLWFDMFRGHMGPQNALRLEIAGLYWHFVDIVWIVIFTLVYLMEFI